MYYTEPSIASDYVKQKISKSPATSYFGNYNIVGDLLTSHRIPASFNSHISIQLLMFNYYLLLCSHRIKLFILSQGKSGANESSLAVSHCQNRYWSIHHIISQETAINFEVTLVTTTICLRSRVQRCVDRASALNQDNRYIKTYQNLV